MSNLEKTQVENEIGKQFHDLKAGLREIAREEMKGHVDVLLKEKVERIDAAMNESDDKLQKANEVLAKAKAMRQASDVLDTVDGELKDAWIEFIRKNTEDMSVENRQMMKTHSQKSLNSASDPSGGYLVIPYFDTQVTQRLYETSPIRSIATIKTISTDQYEKPTQLDLAGAYWQDRDHDYTETDTQTWGRLTIRVHKLISHPKVSQDLLDDAYVNVEEELLNSIATSMDLLENTAFVLGDGVGQPRGFLTYPAGTGWGQIEQIASGNATLVTPDALTDLVYSLKDGYLANARFVASRASISAIRKLTDGNGNALWTPQFGSEPAQIMGYPVTRASDMPGIAAGTLPIAFGDFRRAYIIVDRMGTRILRNPYLDAPFVRFTTTRRVGGAVDNFEAIKLLKVAAS